MTAALLVGPAVVIGAFALLYATTLLERLTLASPLDKRARPPLLNHVGLSAAEELVGPPAHTEPPSSASWVIRDAARSSTRLVHRTVCDIPRTASCGSHDKEGSPMGIVVSMLLIAAGAIMRFAVTAEGDGFNVGTAGMVLMVVGIIGAVLSVAFWASRGGFGHRTTVVGTDRTVVREREVL